MSALATAGFVNEVQGGPLLLAAAVAVVVGVVGFLSPCVLPLVPGYLSYVAGLSGSGDRPSQKRMVAGAVLFVLGFTILYVAEGAVFGQLGETLRVNQLTIERWLGVVTIIFGIVFLGGIGFLQREFKFHKLPRAGLAGAPLLGATFALAWTPCSTPTFGAINAMSFTEGTVGRGAFLMACYCLGLGVPFVLVALGFGWVSSALAFVRRHRRVVSGIGGAVLIVFGVLLVTGEWNHWMESLQTAVGPGGFSV